MKKLIPLGQQLLAVFLSFALLFTSVTPALAKATNYKYTDDKLRKFPAFKEAEAEYKAMLQRDDMSVEERKYIELALERERLYTGFQIWKSDNWDKINPEEIATEQAAFQLDDQELARQQDELDKFSALWDYYTLSNDWSEIEKVVQVLHGTTDVVIPGGALKDVIKAKTKEIKAELSGGNSKGTQNQSAGAPKDDDSAGGPSPDTLLEVMDPIVYKPGDIDTFGASADAARALFYTFLAYNHNPSIKLTGDELQNAIWLAQRSYARAYYQYNRLRNMDYKKWNYTPNSTTTRDIVDKNTYKRQYAEHIGAHALFIYTELLIQEAKLFLQNNSKKRAITLTPEEKKLKDAAYFRSGLGVTEKKDGKTIVIDKLKDIPTLDHRLSLYVVAKIIHNTIVEDEIADIVNYVMYYKYFDSKEDPNNVRTDIRTLCIKICDKGERNNWKKGASVNKTFFAALFVALMTLPVNDAEITQIYNMLADGVKTHRSIALRIEAARFAGLLRQLGKDGTAYYDGKEVNIAKDFSYLKHESFRMFDDKEFRQYMAAYIVDMYAPTLPANAGKAVRSSSKDKNGNPQVERYEDERYGLDISDREGLSNDLAGIFESFLPVEEPACPRKTIQDGPYAGCEVRDYGKCGSKDMSRLFAGGAVSKKREHPCTDQDPLYNVENLVRNHTNHFVGMQKYHHYADAIHRQETAEWIAGIVAEEVVTWYLFGWLLKGAGALFSVAWRAFRAASVATKVAFKVQKGMKLVRFESKFAQVYKYTGKAWQKEAGIAKITMEETGTTKVLLDNGAEVAINTTERLKAGSLEWRMQLRRSVEQYKSGRLKGPLTGKKVPEIDPKGVKVNPKLEPQPKGKPELRPKGKPEPKPRGRPQAKPEEPVAKPGEGGKPQVKPEEPAVKPGESGQPKPNNGGSSVGPDPTPAKPAAPINEATARGFIQRLPQELLEEADAVWVGKLSKEEALTLKKALEQVKKNCLEPSSALCSNNMEFIRVIMGKPAANSELVDAFLKYPEFQKAFRGQMNKLERMQSVSKSMGAAYEEGFMKAFGKDYMYLSPYRTEGRLMATPSMEVKIQELYDIGARTGKSWPAVEKELADFSAPRDSTGIKKVLGLQANEDKIVMLNSQKGIQYIQVERVERIMKDPRAAMGGNGTKGLYVFKGQRQGLDVSNVFGGKASIASSELRSALKLEQDIDRLLIETSNGWKEVVLDKNVSKGLFEGLEDLSKAQWCPTRKLAASPQQIIDVYSGGMKTGLNVPEWYGKEQTQAFLKDAMNKLTGEFKPQVLEKAQQMVGGNVKMINTELRAKATELSSSQISPGALKTDMHIHYEVTLLNSKTGTPFLVNISIPVHGNQALAEMLSSGVKLF